MYFTPEANALIDEIFALEFEIANPKSGEDAILLSSLLQPQLNRRAFYLSLSKAFLESYRDDLLNFKAAQFDVLPKVYSLLETNDMYTAEVDAVIAEEFQGVEKLRERYPLVFKSAPPMLESDATPPQRSMEFRLRMSYLCYSEKNREELKANFAALKAEGVTPLARQVDILAQLEGYRNAAVAESARQEALFDLAYGDEEFLCGGEL